MSFVRFGPQRMHVFCAQAGSGKANLSCAVVKKQRSAGIGLYSEPTRSGIRTDLACLHHSSVRVRQTNYSQRQPEM